MDRKEITHILSSAGLRPRHQFGQNFMVDQRTLAMIADAGAIQPPDVVLEVGPGVGNLTRQLAQRASVGAVLAVDIDKKLMPAAQRHHAGLHNVHWLNADVLAGKHELNEQVLAKLRELRLAHPHGELKLVSNLPYNAASPLIANLLVMMWGETKVSSVQCPVSGSPPLPQDFSINRAGEPPPFLSGRRRESTAYWLLATGYWPIYPRPLCRESRFQCRAFI